MVTSSRAVAEAVLMLDKAKAAEFRMKMRRAFE